MKRLKQGVGRSLKRTSALAFRSCSLLLLFPPVFSSASGSEVDKVQRKHQMLCSRYSSARR